MDPDCFRLGPFPLQRGGPFFSGSYLEHPPSDAFSYAFGIAQACVLKREFPAMGDHRADSFLVPGQRMPESGNVHLLADDHNPSVAVICHRIIHPTIHSAAIPTIAAMQPIRSARFRARSFAA
jgi:hypothetical protein